jgi:hypothetical protein
MRTKHQIAVGSLLLALIVTGCTTATPYQPYRAETAGGVHGGYSDQRLSPDRYTVRFHGNELTSRDRVEGYMLYRAAELTLQHGYDWFLAVDRHTEHDTQTYVTPDPFYRPYYGPAYDHWRPSWRYYRSGYGWNDWYPSSGGRFWADQLDVRTVESFEAQAEILMRRGSIPAGELRTFDARTIIRNLDPGIERPKS